VEQDAIALEWNPREAQREKLWLGVDRQGRVAVFDAGAQGTPPKPAALLNGPTGNLALQNECKLAWLLARPVVEITSSDDLECYDEGEPFVAVIEEIELAQALEERGVARSLADANGIRIALGPKATEADAEQIRTSETYLGSMRLDEDLWRESVRDELQRFELRSDQYERRGPVALTLSLDSFDPAVHALIVPLDTDFERNNVVRVGGTQASAPPQASPFAIDAAPARLRIAAPAEGVSRPPSSPRREPVAPPPTPQAPLEDDDLEVESTAASAWLPLALLCLAVLAAMMLAWWLG